MTHTPVQPKQGKSFFDYSDKEKKRIIHKALKESNTMQRELVESVKPKEKKVIVLTPHQYKIAHHHFESTGAIVVEDKTIPPPQEAEEVDDVAYYILPYDMKRVYGVDKSGMQYVGMEINIKDLLQEQKEKVVEEIEKKINGMIYKWDKPADEMPDQWFQHNGALYQVLTVLATLKEAI